MVTLKSTHLEGMAFGVPPGVLRLALAGMDRKDDDALASLALRHDVGAAHSRLSSLGRLHLEVAQAGIAAGALAKSAGLAPLSTSGHVATALPTTAMKSRRLIGFVLRPRTTPYHT